MAKHRLFLHIGPGAVDVDADFRERLAAAGIRTPDVGQGDRDRADLEIRRAHKSAGLKRKDVEGAWAKVCRRIFKLRGDAYLGMPHFIDAEVEQAELALDGLHGLKVHLVHSGGADAKVPAAWARRLKASRVHALEPGLDAAALADAIAQLALQEEKARLDKTLIRLKRRRREVKDQLVA